MSQLLAAAAFACAGGWLANLSISVYAHRTLAHRAVTLHPAVAHLFRFCIWLTTGTKVRGWVAVHRKHHAFADRPGDPHSPVVYGLWPILLNVYGFYRRAMADTEALKKYGKGCPDDALERHLYGGRGYLGLLTLFGLDLLLFRGAAIGVAVGIQLTWMLVMAGIINGLGHAVGYRNHDCADYSRNIVPWALLIGGEELHNNHHQWPRSARFSFKWWELDIGWGVIRALAALGLARDIYVGGRRWRDPGQPPDSEPTALPQDPDPVAAAVAVMDHDLDPEKEPA